MRNILKTSCLFIVFVCMISDVYGQNAIGGKIGYNIATFRGDTEEFEDKGFVFGLQFGGVFEYGINDQFSIQPELLYIKKGVSNEFLGFDGDGQTDLIFNYIELPILVKYKYGATENLNLYFTGGPTVGFLESGRSETDLFVGGDRIEENVDLEFGDDDSFRRFEIGISIGIGAYIPLGVGNLFGEARFATGITDLNDNDLSDASTSNIGLGLSIGYLYPLGN